MAQTKKAKQSVKKEPVKSLPTNITAKNLTNWEKKEFVDYLIKKEGRISKLTKHFSEDSVLLTASVEKFEKHTAFKVLLKLTIPSEMIIAEESAHAMTKGLDDATDRLITQLKKHIDKVKNK